MPYTKGLKELLLGKCGHVSGFADQEEPSSIPLILYNSLKVIL
jgi:hypothetical protein